MQLLIIIKDNVVDTIKKATDGNDLERLFTDECRSNDIIPVSENYENGFIELPDGTSICMTSV